MYRRVSSELLLAVRDSLDQVNAKLVGLGLPSEIADINAVAGIAMPMVVFKPTNRFIVGPMMTNPRANGEAHRALIDAAASWAVHRHYRLQLARAKQSLIPNTYDPPRLSAYRSARWNYYFEKLI